MRSNADIAPVFTITVDDPQRVGDPIRGYTMYTVHTKVRVSLLPRVSVECSLKLLVDELPSL